MQSAARLLTACSDPLVQNVDDGIRINQAFTVQHHNGHLQIQPTRSMTERMGIAAMKEYLFVIRRESELVLEHRVDCDGFVRNIKKIKESSNLVAEGACLVAIKLYVQRLPTATSTGGSRWRRQNSSRLRCGERRGKRRRCSAECEQRNWSKSASLKCAPEPLRK